MLSGRTTHASVLLSLATVVFSVFALPALAAEAGKEAYPRREVEYAEFPASAQGAYPIHIPAYDGVSQVMVLSDKWIVVAVENVQEVMDAVNELSNGRLYEAADDWDKARAAGKNDWTAYKDMPTLRENHMAQAREMAGERLLDLVEHYSIKSDDDSRYASARRPLRVTRILVPLNNKQVRASHDMHYAHYCFMELPEPMQTGKSYTISLADGKKATLLFDEMRTISRAIKVNQVGYLPDAGRKYAYLGAYAYEFGPINFAEADKFHVISVKTGKPVYSGPIRLREKNPRFAVQPGKNVAPEERPLISGEDIYEMDLTPLKEEGEFFISIPGVGRSWPFRHAKDAYGQAFYTAARGMYHQRCGIALEKPYTMWERIRCHAEPVFENGHIPWGPGHFSVPKGYRIFDVIGYTTDDSKQTDEHVGGWHDAADWDRGIYHYANVFDLLYAYELAPRKFRDGQLNIPESGNGIPDILDEAEFGILVWKKSMDERGAVSGMVETWTHPPIDDTNVKYGFSRRTRWSSLVYASAAAQYAHLVKPFNAERALEYEASAKKAFAFGSDPANSLGEVTIEGARNRGKGEKFTLEWKEEDKMIVPYLLQAKLRLYVLTGDKEYLSGVEDLARQMPSLYEWPLTYKDFSIWFGYEIVRGAADVLPEDIVEKWKADYRRHAENLSRMIDQQPYRFSWPRHQDYWIGWGLSDMTNMSRVLLAAHAITGDAKFREAAVLNADYMLGGNPMGMSWTTGLGYVYPVVIQHANSQYDGILDPVPGITLYGIDGGPMYSQFRREIWQSPAGDGSGMVDFIKPENRNVPFWRRWAAHPNLNVGQCEFTIHETMASTIFTFALLMNEDWMPDEELKAKGPRKDDLLFGYWYLP